MKYSESSLFTRRYKKHVVLQKKTLEKVVFVLEKLSDRGEDVLEAAYQSFFSYKKHCKLAKILSQIVES